MTKKKFSREDEVHYAELAEKINAGDFEVVPGSVLTGAAAAEAGRAFLLKEYGSEEALAEALRPGRPKLGNAYERGPSREIRGRVTAQQFRAIAELQKRTSRSQSEIVRDAIQALLEKENAQA